MRDKNVQELANEISTLQSKLGVLRSELYRKPEELSTEEKRGLEVELGRMECAIDNLQERYKRKKEVINA